MTAIRHLEAYERDPELLRGVRPADLRVVTDELASLPSPLTRLVRLGEWASAAPRATGAWLGLLADDPVQAALVAPTLAAWLGRLGPASPLIPAVDEVLATAFPTLHGPWRDAAAERPAVRARHDPRVDPLPEGGRWPAGAALPPVGRVEGVQARLDRLGYGTPLDGAWSEATRRALARWQLHNGLEPTGELDDDTADELTAQTG
jgi:hypothetical protein